MKNGTYYFKCISFCLLFLLLCFSSKGTEKSDSLKQALSDHHTSDTTKVNLLIAICKESLREMNYKEYLQRYAPQMLALSNQLHFKKGIAYAYIYISMSGNQQVDYAMEENYLQKALKLLKEINDKSSIAYCYDRMARTKGLHGQDQSAIELHLKALALKKELNDVAGIGTSYSFLGRIYTNIGNFDKSLEYLLKALKIAETTNDKNKICESLISIGIVFFEQKKYKETIAYMNKALMVEGEAHTSKINLTYIYNNIAISYTSLNDKKKALSYQLLALQLTKELNDQLGATMCYGNISSLYSEMGRKQEALKYALLAVSIGEKADYKIGLTYAYIGAGNCYEDKKENTNAYYYYLKALKLAKEINYKTQIRDAYQHLSSISEVLNDYSKALEYHKLYSQVKDSILNEESLKQSSELNIRYETDKKEKEILLLTKDQQLKDKNLKEQRLIRIGLIIGLGLFLVLSFLLYNRYRFKQRANQVLEKQKEEIRTKNTLITDSIDYAKTIQDAILPDDEQLSSDLSNYFVLYKPKDIVSGDFYWTNRKGNKITCAVADCTGHGVPGAFMSLLGHNILDNVVKQETAVDPGAVLTSMNQQIMDRFSKGHEAAKNGMDIAIINIDLALHQLDYAGAKNSVYIVRENILTELKADKVSLGTPGKNNSLFNYTNQVHTLQKGDMIYLFSDGFPDQKGGTEKKKFYYQPFKDLLVSISHLPLEEQKQKLDSAITTWIGKAEQIDDILVMGIRYEV